MRKEELQELIENTVTATIETLNKTPIKDVKRDEAFKNTETLLYNYKCLKEHVTDEEGYYGMIGKKKAGSFVSYSKNKCLAPDEEAMLDERRKSLVRSQRELARIENALDVIKERKQYRVIELRYFERDDNGETYKWEAIASKLVEEGVVEYITEKTVRTWRNNLIKEIAVRIFGADAI